MSQFLQKSDDWGFQEKKAFEIALAGAIEIDHVNGVDDRLMMIAPYVPTKSPSQIEQYDYDLIYDLYLVDTNQVPLPNYDDDHHDVLPEETNADLSKSTPPPPPPAVPVMKRKKVRSWTVEEHRSFLDGLEKYGKGDWKNIAQNCVVTRTATQVASHAQKYYLRLKATNKKRRSIHDDHTESVSAHPIQQQQLQQMQQPQVQLNPPNNFSHLIRVPPTPPPPVVVPDPMQQQRLQEMQQAQVQLNPPSNLSHLTGVPPHPMQQQQLQEMQRAQEQLAMYDALKHFIHELNCALSK